MSQAPSSKRRAKFTIGGVAVVLIVMTLIAWAMTRPGSTAFFLTVSEVRDSAGSELGGEIRVSGNLVGGSVERDGVTMSFAITDGEKNLNIVTEETPPDAFWSAYESDPESVEIIAQGSYDGEQLSANEIFAKCPSKFKAKV